MRRIIALALFFPALAVAGWGGFDFQYQEQRPQAEQPVTLPAYPEQKNLLPFFVSATTNNRFFIDGKSVTVGGDGVVHYTLVVKSPSGALNVTFEGIRCATRSDKIYAFGRNDGTWALARRPQWRRIVYRDRNRQEHVLFDDFFCPGGIAVGSSREALDALRNGYEQ